MIWLKYIFSSALICPSLGFRCKQEFFFKTMKSKIKYFRKTNDTGRVSISEVTASAKSIHGASMCDEFSAFRIS